jgi:hypothetical protein
MVPETWRLAIKYCSILYYMHYKKHIKDGLGTIAGVVLQNRREHSVMFADVDV